MANIKNVYETRWNQPDGKMGFQYMVLYDSGRKFLYNWQMNLPKTVLDFILSDDVVAETTYPNDEYNKEVTKRTKYSVK